MISTELDIFYFQEGTENWENLTHEVEYAAVEMIALDLAKNYMKEHTEIVVSKDFINQFKSLKEINLTKVSSFIKDFDFLIDSGIESIYLGTLRLEANFPLHQLTNLIQLVLHETLNDPDTCYGLIQKIKSCHNLRALTIYGWELLFGCKMLVDLADKNLEYFHLELIEGEYLDEKISDLLQVQNITSLDVSYFAEFVTSYEPLLKLPKLNQLYLSKLDTEIIGDFDDLKNRFEQKGIEIKIV